MITSDDLNKLANSPEGEIFALELIKLVNAQDDHGVLACGRSLRYLARRAQDSRCKEE